MSLFLQNNYRSLLLGCPARVGSRALGQWERSLVIFRCFSSPSGLLQSVYKYFRPCSLIDDYCLESINHSPCVSRLISYNVLHSLLLVLSNNPTFNSTSATFFRLENLPLPSYSSLLHLTLLFLFSFFLFFSFYFTIHNGSSPSSPRRW